MAVLPAHMPRTERPDWADADVLRICAPDLVRPCQWPGCHDVARYELEFDDDGAWLARRLCPGHRRAVNDG